MIALAAVPALLLHGWMIGALPAGSAIAAPRPVAAPVRVRALAPPVEMPAAQLDAVSAAPLLAERPRAAPAVDARRSAAPEPADPPAAFEHDAGPVSGEPELALAADVPDAGSDPAHAGEDAGLPAPDDAALLLAAANVPQLRVDDALGLDVVDGDAIPVYATSFPPSQTLRYDLQRGIVGGTGELSWRRDPPDRPGAGYELQLQAKIGALTILTQISKGGFDKAGLAPVRFTDQRLRGSVRAANFQRVRKLISFSGPTVEYPMVRGVQDRLSWMMQVPAILAANPRLAAPGQRITMYVVGARGDAATWDFKFEGRERLVTAAGEVATVKFSRQPRKEFDTLAEVWLDPARHYLAVKARVGNPEEGAMLEMRRVD